MKIQIVTLFPKIFEGGLSSSMLWKAQDMGKVEYNLIDLRQFGLGRRKTVDDTPYGGGDGMLLRVEPVFAAVEAAKKVDPKARVILPTPRGNLYKQSNAIEFAGEANGLIIVCPRYEGYDERITEIVDYQFRIGNYVLTGGDIPALAIVDSVVRLLPGVLGGANSVEVESFQQDDVTSEFPQYTRPEVFRGMRVPEILLNGNHAEIDKWRDSKRKVQKS